MKSETSDKDLENLAYKYGITIRAIVFKNELDLYHPLPGNS